MITHLFGKTGGEKMPINWIKAGIMFFALFFTLYLIIKTAQKNAKKLNEEKHKKEKPFKTRSIG